MALDVMNLSILFLVLILFPCDRAGFLCPLSANSYGVEFLSFAIMDYETKNIIFEVGKDKPPPSDMSIDFSSSSASGEDMYRRIKYNFSEDVLRLPYIQTT